MVTAVEGDVVVLVDNVEVVLATIEELTSSAVVTLTGDTVVDDTGTADVDTVVILELKSDVDCNVVLVEGLGGCVADTVVVDAEVEYSVGMEMSPGGDCDVVVVVVLGVADTGGPNSDTADMLCLERDVECNVLVEGLGSCVVI